jgi:hypothetical protein
VPSPGVPVPDHSQLTLTLTLTRYTLGRR